MQVLEYVGFSSLLSSCAFEMGQELLAAPALPDKPYRVGKERVEL